MKFTKDKVTCDFEEAENFENIKSGESIGTLFGKIKRWFSEIKNCVKKDDLKDLPERYYDADGTKGGIILTSENEFNVASGKASIASGLSCKATGEYSIAMGVGSEASHAGSISIGFGNHALNTHTVAIGDACVSKGRNSICIGERLQANGENQSVLGKRNIIDYSNKYAFIIGNGDATTLSNALTLDWYGKLWTAGDVTATDSSGNNVSLCEVKTLLENILERVEKLEEKAITEITTEKIDEIMEG